jgi:ATP-dependent DNA ligase
VKLLAGQIPASVVFFDLLCEGDRDLCKAPFRERRAVLESLIGPSLTPPLHVTPATRDRAVAGDWFSRFEGAGLDGVIAKAEHGTYEPNKRVMLKVKHERDCDCVVAGFRWHKNEKGTALAPCCSVSSTRMVTSSTLVCASFTAAKRRELGSSSSHTVRTRSTATRARVGRCTTRRRGRRIAPVR